MKLCTKCQQTFTVDQFYKARHTKDGLTGWCKTCFSENHLKNKEHYKITKTLSTTRRGRRYVDLSKLEVRLIKPSEPMQDMLRVRVFWATIFNELKLTTELSSKFVSEQIRLADSELHDYVNELAWKGHEGIPEGYNDTIHDSHSGTTRDAEEVE